MTTDAVSYNLGFNQALEAACRIVYEQAGSDNVAERTVRAIKKLRRKAS